MRSAICDLPARRKMVHILKRLLLVPALLLLAVVGCGKADLPPAQVAALEDFWDATGGPQWFDNDDMDGGSHWIIGTVRKHHSEQGDQGRVAPWARWVLFKLPCV